MPRSRPPPSGEIGRTLDEAMRSRNLSPQQVAAAARLNKGTLYKILSGETTAPHHSTLRRICKVLHIDLASLLGAEQLELLDSKVEAKGSLAAMEKLLLRELISFDERDRDLANQVALFALLEVKSGVLADQTPNARGDLLAEAPSTGPSESRIRRNLNQIPPFARPSAVRSAMGALLDLKILLAGMTGAGPVRRIHHLRFRLWCTVERRKRPETRGDP